MGANKYNGQLLVSIQCAVYNHEPYLRQCLDGFVMQKTNFKFEAIVHDDASTDRSSAIIKEYADKYPDIIKPIFEAENQYSKGDGSLSRIMDAASIGKYIAICEGDDYWTDENKLQKQVDWLENHPDYVLIADNALVCNSITNKEYLFNQSEDKDYLIADMIKTRRFPTAGVLYRKKAQDGFYETCRYSYDTMLWCYLATKGKIHFCSQVSSVYRRGMQGITEYTGRYKFALMAEKWNKELVRVFGSYFDESIVSHNMYNAFMSAIDGADMKVAIRCILKMLRYEPLSTCKFVVKLVGKRMLFR